MSDGESRVGAVAGRWAAFRSALGRRPVATGLAGLWLLAMIALPLVSWGAGATGAETGPDAAIPRAVTVAVIAQAALVSYLVGAAAGARTTIRTAALILVLGWAAEWLGSHTGWPFGAYHYTDRLGGHLLGVPWVIPLSWWMMLPAAWALAQRWTGRRSGVVFIGAAAAAMTAWDLYLDPQMVGWGMWQWEGSGAYFGIPLSNFAGWWLVSALLTWAARPPWLGEISGWLIGLYAAVCVLEFGGLAFFWDLSGPAWCGLLGMGTCALLAMRRAPTGQPAAG